MDHLDLPSVDFESRTISWVGGRANACFKLKHESSDSKGSVPSARWQISSIHSVRYVMVFAPLGVVCAMVLLPLGCSSVLLGFIYSRQITMKRLVTRVFMKVGDDGLVLPWWEAVQGNVVHALLLDLYVQWFKMAFASWYQFTVLKKTAGQILARERLRGGKWLVQ